MASKSELPKRVENLIAQCRNGKTVCLTIKHSAVGDEREYWLEPGGNSVGAWTVQRAIELGLLTPSNDGLFPDMESQTYRAAEREQGAA
jgi:hypothetical protein